ncbi:MAG TPA: DUF4265 domain-containing protein [Gemmatimonadaceae bacterium]|nr:DUF4265 domain-containing protein [Gemmatimonadaceae bacterium]
MSRDALEQLLIEFPASDHGIEVLRAESVDGDGYRILSVPVFLYALSRGALVDAEPGPRGRLRFQRMRRPSPGATIRCYASVPTTPRHVYEDYLDGALARRLGLGPVSLLDPDIVAVHLADRARLTEVAVFLDQLVLTGVLRFWEQGDPGAPLDGAKKKNREQPWELVHPPALETSRSERSG